MPRVDTLIVSRIPQIVAFYFNNDPERRRDILLAQQANFTIKSTFKYHFVILCFSVQDNSAFSADLIRI